MSCCPGSCGSNAPFAACQGAPPAAQTPAPVNSQATLVAQTPAPVDTQATPTSQAAGTACSVINPNPCYNWDGSRLTCCPGACGSVNNPEATCEGAPAVQQTPPTAAPVGPVQNHPVTPNPAPSPGTQPPATPAPTVTQAPTTQAPVNPNPLPADTVLPAPPAGFKWVVNPQLSDEFNGDSLDTSKWRPTHPYWSGRLPSQFNANNVRVSGGNAQLTSTTTVNNINQVADPDNDPWISAAVIASNSAAASLGYYEARMKASAISMTSSFWFQSGTSEIDVIETMGIASDYRSRYMPINTHYYPSGIAPNTPDLDVGDNVHLPSGLTSDNFHAYGVWWKDAETLIFYLDGQQVWQTTPDGPFTDNMYLFFDTECFAAEAIPTVADLQNPAKSTMLVDHVRAFSLQPV